jgi:hypothetical protein
MEGHSFEWPSLVFMASLGSTLSRQSSATEAIGGSRSNLAVRLKELADRIAWERRLPAGFYA